MKSAVLPTLKGIVTGTLLPIQVLSPGEEKELSFKFFKTENDALAAYTQALRLNPKDAEAHCHRGRAYENKNDKDKAIADLKAVE